MSQMEVSGRNLARAYQAARIICGRHARSFYFASFFLPQPKRNHAYAVYAFCRLMDDAIDVPITGSCCEGELDRRFDLLRQRLDDIYAGRLAEPGDDEASLALHAFAHTVECCAIPMHHFLDLAEGCRMDLTITRYATWADLERYCYLVAGVVGLIMCRVFDLRREEAQKQAVTMGNAMQLTNILRDVKEDWNRGRIYLPKEDLDRFGCTERDIAAGVVTDGFRKLMRFEIERARALYHAGAEGLCHLPSDGSRFTASAMAVIYSGILDAIERLHCDVFSARAHLKTWQKILRLPRAMRLCRRENGEPLPRVFE
ncbi:MAG: phytoene/squalene synthase family protein [Tepidisphaeraceae bacterium]